MAIEFPEHRHTGQVARKELVNGEPVAVIGGRQAGGTTEREVKRVIRKEGTFVAKIHSQIAGRLYRILAHQKRDVFSGLLLQAYWVREAATDPSPEVGDIVIARRNREGRYDFFTQAPEMNPFTARVMIDAGAIDVASVNGSMTNTLGGDEQRILAKLRSPMNVRYDSVSGTNPFSFLFNYWNCWAELAYVGGGPAYTAVSWGAEIYAITGDFNAATATWRWAITDANLSFNATPFLLPLTAQSPQGSPAGLTAPGYPISTNHNPNNGWTPNGNGYLEHSGKFGVPPGTGSDDDWSGYGQIHGIMIVAKDPLLSYSGGGGTSFANWETDYDFHLQGAGIWNRPPWW